MQRLALAAARMPAPPRTDRDFALGIWEPRAARMAVLEFARSAVDGRRPTSGDYWADIGSSLPRKSGLTGWCWFGESVARALFCSTRR
jgi:hypothetical protein